MKNQLELLRALVVGCGNMGSSHAIAYHMLGGMEICGRVSNGKSKEILNRKLGNNYSSFDNMEEALSTTHLDAVCIFTYGARLTE